MAASAVGEPSHSLPAEVQRNDLQPTAVTCPLGLDVLTHHSTMLQKRLLSHVAHQRQLSVRPASLGAPHRYAPHLFEEPIPLSRLLPPQSRAVALALTPAVSRAGRHDCCTRRAMTGPRPRAALHPASGALRAHCKPPPARHTRAYCGIASRQHSARALGPRTRRLTASATTWHAVRSPNSRCLADLAGRIRTMPARRCTGGPHHQHRRR